MTDDKTFVDLVLERMETNPEEFIEGSSKFRWDALIHALRASGVGPQNNSLTVSTYNNNVLWALNEDEIKALSVKYKEVYREFLRREFIKNIMDEPNALRPSLGFYDKISRVTAGIQKPTPLISGSRPTTVITTSEMRVQAEQVLQAAIDREAREGNWGAISGQESSI